MEEIKNATEANAQTIASVGTVTSAATEDLEAKVSLLETEKAKVEEERNNYRSAYLKEKAKGSDSDEDEKMRYIAQETLANSHLAEIAREQDAIIKKALKENKELKIAQMNKTDIPVSTTSHTETNAVVRDTSVTPEQLAIFKAKGWTDKDIERYKKNMQRNK